jgi:hypothetical protein
MGASRERIEPIGDRQAISRTPGAIDPYDDQQLAAKLRSIESTNLFISIDISACERASNGDDTPLSVCFGLPQLVCPCVAQLIMQFADL